MFGTAQPYKVNLPRETSKAAVVFDSPHSGRTLPLHFKHSCSTDKLADFGDLHVDKLLRDIPAHGVPVLECLIHRACVDMNRHQFEIDPNDIRGGWNKPYSLSHYTQAGIGVVPRRLGRPHDKPLTPIFNATSQPDQPEIQYRFDQYHDPYYRKLHHLLAEARKQHGFYIHVDMHSFFRRTEEGSDDIIIGDMYGTSCAGSLTDFIADHFRQNGFTVDFNGLFQGGAIIQKTSAPLQGHHAIQIEVARDLYLADNMRDYDAVRAGKLKDTLSSLSRALDNFARNPAYTPDLKPFSPKTAAQLARNAASTGPKPPA